MDFPPRGQFFVTACYAANPRLASARNLQSRWSGQKILRRRWNKARPEFFAAVAPATKVAFSRGVRCIMLAPTNGGNHAEIVGPAG
jgi:hypothetical protein